MSEMVKCYEVSPAADGSYDHTVIRAGGDDAWRRLFDEVEESLERQESAEMHGEAEWNDISIKIKCVMHSEQFLRELGI